MSKPKWTDEQLAAITARNANLLVAAAAGAGKTAVLVERIIRRVTDPADPLDVDRLLVVTFTNAAAAEMRERIGKAIAAKLNEDPGNRHLEHQLVLLNLAPITTLHSFCLEVLRQHYYRLDLDPAFRIADDAEAALLQLQVLEELFEQRYTAEDTGFARLVDSYGGERDDTGLKDLVLKLFDFSRSHPWPEEWLKQSAKAFQLPEGTKTTGNPWFDSLKDSLAIDLEGARDMLDRAIALAGSPGGPEVYQANLLADMQVIQSLISACHKSWEELYQEFKHLSWGKLKSCRKGVDEGLKKQVKTLRENAKKTIEKIKNDYFSRTAAELMADLQKVAPLVQSLVCLVSDYTRAYQQAKQKRGLIDFNDMEHFALRILLAPDANPGDIIPSEVAQEFRARFAEVLIDEYQDINGVQETILRLVSRQGQEQPNLFMVGDVKQSIYRFRQAEPKLFLEKYGRYPLGEGGQERRIDLGRNFRSREEVVRAVNFIFRQIMTERVGEMTYDQAAELIFSADYPGVSAGEGITVAGPAELHLIELDEEAHPLAVEQKAEESEDTAGDDSVETEELDALQLEARIIARRIKELLGLSRADGGPYLVFDKARGYRPVSYRDIVILLRATRGAANTFLEEFRLAGIPVYAELGTGYFAAAEVEAMLSLLKVIDNPRQDVPLAAVLRSPLVGLTAAELARIRLAAPRGDFYQAAKAAARADLGSLSERVSRFLGQLEKWRTMARQGSLSDLIWQIYRETGYYDYVAGMPGGTQRQANLRLLYDRAKQYEATMFKGLFGYLRFIEHFQESGNDLGAARALGENEDVVRIMSIHKSKGLEFPVVFIAGLGKKFNLRDTRGSNLLHKDLGIGPELVDLEARIKYPSLAKLAIKEKIRLENLAEEMRVFYVALTRAREKLILVGSVKGLETKAGNWCQYLREEGWPLPATALSAAATYLDWICPAIARHSDAQALRRLGGWDGELPGKPACDPSRWEIRLWDHSHGQLPETRQAESDSDLFDKVRSLEPVDVPEELMAVVKERLSWRYPYQTVVEKPAKVTVTEVTFQESTGKILSSGSSRLPVATRRPRFLVGEQGLSGAERGSVLHMVIQHLDLKGDLSPEAIRAQVERMVQQEFLTQEQARVVDEEQLARVFTGDLGRRIRQAARVRREVPFSLALPANEIYPDIIDDREEKVLIQGVIDCLIEEEDGFVLIDWKTDQVGPENIQAAVERYRVQLNLYARAVETILKQPVKEKYLYFLEPGLEILI